MYSTFSLFSLFVATIAAQAVPVIRVLNSARTSTPLIQNGGFEEAREQTRLARDPATQITRKRVLDSGNGQAHCAKMKPDEKQFSLIRGASEKPNLIGFS